MRNPIRKSWHLVAAVLLCFASHGFAQQTASMTLTSGGTNVLDGVYVDTYTVSINGVSTQVICDDYRDDSYIGESWTANVANFSNLSGTQNTTEWGLGAKATQDYNEAAWLTLQMLSTTNKMTAGEIQFAIWGVFDPSAIPNLTSYNSNDGAAAQRWLNNAASQTWTQNEFSQFSVYSANTSDPITCNGGPCPNSPPQEFLAVAESPFVITLGADLLGLALAALIFRRRLVRAIS